MGLFDWLNDAIGGSGIGSVGSAMPEASMPQTGLYNPSAPPPPNLGATPAPAPTQPMPAVQPTDTTGGPAPVQPLDMTSGPGSSLDAPPPATPPGLPGGVPLPQPRPPGAGPGAGSLGPAYAAAPTPATTALPAGATPTAGTGTPGQPMNIQTPAQQGQTALGRALGITPEQGGKMVKEFGSGLAAGLKSVGQNWNKPGLAAFSASAGAAIEGEQKRQDTTYDQKIKALQQSVAAQAAGDKAAYNKAYATYLGAKLKNDTDKAASSGGKSGSWNKPDSQKFIDASNALAKDPDIRASEKILEQTAKTGTPEEVAAAQAKHSQLVQQKQAMYLSGVGLSPQAVQNMAKNPPGSQSNPIKVTSQSDFDNYVKPGQAYVNPKDGKVYIRNNGDAKGGGDSQGAGAPAAAAPSAPEPPGPAPGTKTDDDE